MDVDGATSSKSPWKYHVFLSFRGEDTRTNFTDHLYTALWKKGIITYRDDENLDRGKVIRPELFAAIEQSFCAVVILSQNYASSTWCLDELLKILESNKVLGTQVFPIFYGVDPSEVRRQGGRFAEALKEHEEKFRASKEKIQEWRHALEEVANFSGWSNKNRHEANLIEEIVVKVWTNLQPKLPTYHDEGLVGIDSKVEDIYLSLRLGLNDVRFIGIWGMGGIGKTTLATVVFNKIESQFDNSCFLDNIRENYGERGHGLVHLQSELLSRLNLKSMDIKNVYQGKDTIRNLLYSKKVLIVLDDVSDKSQLENLVGSRDWFGSGSRVILTTRDMHLMLSNQISVRYEIDILNKHESLQLFSHNAFESDKPSEQYMNLSKQVVQYAGGLPLALKVLGSFLRGRGESQWKETSYKIEQVPENEKLMSTLKISYDGLPNNYKTIFLDIACFFRGWPKSEVKEILDKCDRYPPCGIDILVERGLVTCDGVHLGMHDLLQELGKNIVFEQNPIDAGKRSRLWSLEDIDNVLKNNKGSDLIEGISLESSTELYEARWHPEALSRMSNLKLLWILCDLKLPVGLGGLPSSLKVLEWKGYPLNDLPLGQLDEIVDLKMHHSKIEEFRSGTHFFGKLKFIDLSHSKDLVKTPIVAEVPNLERLVLEGCTKLVEVHESIGQHKNLIVLNLKDCINLNLLPKKLEMNHLEDFILTGCLEIKELPEFGEDMIYLSKLDLKDCKSLVCLPESICNLTSLRILNIAGCLKVCKLPCNMDQNVALEELDVSGTAITEATLSNICLANIKGFSSRGCKEPSSNSWDLSLRLGGIRKFWTQRVAELLNLKPDRCAGLQSMPKCRQNRFYNLKPNRCAEFPSMPRRRKTRARLQSMPKRPRFDKMQTYSSNVDKFCDVNIESMKDWSKISFKGFFDKLESLQSMPKCPRFDKMQTYSSNVDKFWDVNIESMEDWSKIPLESFFYNLEGLQSMPKHTLFHKMQTYTSNVDKFCDIIESIEDWSKNPFQSFFYNLESKIPILFDNFDQNYSSKISAIVGIPDCCHSSRRWGIFVCLMLKQHSGSSIRMSWGCKPPKFPDSSIHEFSKEPFPLFAHSSLQGFRYNYLFIGYFRVDAEPIQLCLGGCREQIEFVFHAFNDEELTKAWGHVLLWEDAKECSKTMMNEVEMVSKSNDYSNTDILHQSWDSSHSIRLALPLLSHLSSLQQLDLSYRNLYDGSVLDNLSCLTSLRRLDLSGNNFCTLPAFIANLHKLWKLKLDHCEWLRLLSKLPPYLRQLSATDCALMEPLSDQHMLWKLIDPPMEYWHIGCFNYVFFIPGTEIPLWFNNRDYFHHKDPFTGDTNLSIIVKIPDHCHSSTWWGIALCLVLEPPESFPVAEISMGARWTCKTSKDSHFLSLPKFSFHHLFIFLVSGNDKIIQQIVNGGQNQLQFIFLGEGGTKPRQAGCRVLWK